MTVSGNSLFLWGILMETKKKIFDALAKLAVLKGQTIAQERLVMYTEILSRYQLEKSLEAISWVALNVKFFPDIVEVLDRVKGKVDPQVYVMEIERAIKRFGYSRGREAKEELSCIAWEVVEGFGGWSKLCSMTTTEFKFSGHAMIKTAKAAAEGALISHKDGLMDVKNTFEGSTHTKTYIE